MSILLLKGMHIACAVTSYALFFLRGIWSFRDSPIIRMRWIRIVPHVVDTLLLVFAIALTLAINQYPFLHAWLTAKVFGVLVYIGLGFVALRYGKTMQIRIFAWILAQAVFIYIVLVAVKHNAVPFGY